MLHLALLPCPCLRPACACALHHTAAQTLANRPWQNPAADAGFLPLLQGAALPSGALFCRADAAGGGQQVRLLSSCSVFVGAGEGGSFLYATCVSVWFCVHWGLRMAEVWVSCEAVGLLGARQAGRAVGGLVCTALGPGAVSAPSGAGAPLGCTVNPQTWSCLAACLPAHPCRHTLDELESLVRDKFAAVPDGGLAPPTFSPDAVAPDQGGLLIRMVPQRDGHSLELQASLGGRARAAGWWGEVPARDSTTTEKGCLPQAPVSPRLLRHFGMSPKAATPRATPGRSAAASGRM